MKVQVKIKSQQIFNDNQEQEEHIADGEITYLKNGTILTFIEKIEDQELNFKLTILPNKILIDRQDQTMKLDYTQDDTCKLNTPYGILNMKVHTQDMQIQKENELITKMILKYQITLENGMEYDNIVTINLKYEKDM